MSSVPFCVVEKPYMVWGPDVPGDNSQFLTRMDANLYYRVAHDIIGKPDPEGGEDTATDESDGETDQERKDVSTLSRLLWHHGMETLVMMLGAYVQAPGAAHAYFLKCKTEDAIELGGHLLREECPKYHRLSGAPFSLTSLLNGIHLCTGWPDRDAMIEHFKTALRNMLRDYVDENHRGEYNSIKHGLRAMHGHFGLAVGIEEIPGVAAPPDAMQMIGSSQDSSFFDVAKPLENATKQQSKINFLTGRTAVTWSLERVIMELQILSLLLHNTVSALRIVGGENAGTVKFNKIASSESSAFWEFYSTLRNSPVPSASFAPVIDARQIPLATEKMVFDSYKRRAQREA